VAINNNRVGRPTHCRCVRDLPKVTCFKPDGIPHKELKSVLLTVDELEAIRLADKEGLYQAEAAVQMNVSRPTFGRILESAHKKVAEALVEGKQLCIQGGIVRSLCDSIPSDRPDICVCPECGYEHPHQKGEPCRETSCSQCGAPLKRKGGCMTEQQP
jgi:predicted DNA-binding protein (UPF0251 family)